MPSGTTDQQTNTEVVEQSTEDRANEGNESGVEGTGEDAAGDSTESIEALTDAEAIELIGQDVFDKVKGDPAKLTKELHRGFTKKMQGLSETQKRLEPYAGFVEELETDPVPAIIAVAEKLGLKIEKGASDKATEQAVENLSDQVADVIKKALGDEYGELADKLAPAIRQAAQMVTEEALKPLKAKTEEVINDSAARESALQLETFGKKRPDWKKYEKEMTELTRKMPPADGMDPQEYLENIYIIASRDGKTGDTIKKTVERMTRSAESGAGGEQSVNGEHVSESPTKPPSFRDAYKAAKAGKRFS